MEEDNDMIEKDESKAETAVEDKVEDGPKEPKEGKMKEKDGSLIRLKLN